VIVSGFKVGSTFDNPAQKNSLLRN